MSTPPEPHLPRVVGGRYRLDRPIGRGGMGTVWQGYDELLGRPVAVKEVRFPPELGAQEIADLRQRTLREARATARLSHPNVITTYDVVEDDDRPWIVMELLSTRSLGEVLAEDGPLAPHSVAELGLGVLAALETAHAHGVVHRDVKPSNVLVTEDGRAVLTDFGIATVAGDPALTSTGVVLGSPSYMAPERARGQAFGPESDLWSLGATLYAAAEGRPPFAADNALGTLTAVVTDPVPLLSCGGPLAPAVAGLLRKDPAERASVAETRALLRAAEADRARQPAAVDAATVALDQAARTTPLPLGLVDLAGSESTPTSARPATAAVPVAAAPPSRPAASVSPPAREPELDRRPGRGPVAIVVTLGLVAVAALLTLAVNNLGAGPGSSSTSPASTKTSPAAAGSARPSGAESPTPGPSPSDASPSDLSASGSPASEPSASEPAASEPAASEPAAGDSSASEPAGAGAEAGAGAVPAGYTRYQDPTGFSVAVPAGWTAVRRSATAVDLREPGGSRFLRIDQTDQPKSDPVVDWQRQEQSVSRRLTAYRGLGITGLDFRGWKAADWEFTFSQGGTVHVRNRGFITSSTQAYALYFSTPESQWAKSQAIFQTVADTFTPTG